MGPLSKVVVLLPYMIWPLEASKDQKWPFSAIFGQKTVALRLFASCELYGGSWLFPDVGLGLLSKSAALLPYIILPLEASRGL